MNKQNLPLTEKEYPVRYHYLVCWSSIFAGAFVGVGLGFLLHIYGMAISLSAFSSSQEGASVIAVGGLLGMLVGVIASMATAGFVAGYLGRYHYYHIHGGVIYGFITWSLALLMSAVIAGPLMHYVSLYENSLTHTIAVETSTTNTTKENKSARVKLKKDTNQNIAKVSPTELAWSGWIVFVLFFIGALSSCIGACCGMKCKRQEE